jgi:hypothetical protein
VRDRARAALVIALAKLGQHDHTLTIAYEQLAVARRRNLPTAEARLLLARARALDAGPGGRVAGGRGGCPSLAILDGTACS